MEASMDFFPKVRHDMLWAEAVRSSAALLNATIMAAVNAGLSVSVEVDGMEPDDEEYGRVPNVAVMIDRGRSERPLRRIYWSSGAFTSSPPCSALGAMSRRVDRQWC
jgi:hypothetical protein